jgi:hypothetical protein
MHAFVGPEMGWGTTTLGSAAPRPKDGTFPYWVKVPLRKGLESHPGGMLITGGLACLAQCTADTPSVAYVIPISRLYAEALQLAKRVRCEKGVLLGETIISDRQVLDDVCNGFEIRLSSPSREDTGNNGLLYPLLCRCSCVSWDY